MKKFLFYFRKEIIALLPVIILLSVIPFSDLIYFIVNQKYLSAIFFFTFGLCLFSIPFFFFRKHLKLYLKLLLPVFIIAPFNLAYVLVFNSKISEATILMIVNTSRNEAAELLKAYIPPMIIFSVGYLALFLYLFKKARGVISTKKAKYISLLSVVFVLLSPFVMYDFNKNYFLNLKTNFDTIFPITLTNSIKTVYDQHQFVKETEKDRNNFRFNSRQDSLINSMQVHVLIIGESSRYDHWGINGYARPTSPLLAKRKNFISYSNIASSCYMTELAVPLILTGVGAEHFDLHSKRKSIISAFKEAGFSTYWIADQSDIGAHIKIHSLEADNVKYLLSDFRSTKNVHHDMDLLHILRKALTDSNEKKFIVLHTIGSHYSYSARYPDEFDIFQPSNKTVFSKVTDKSFKNVLINSYDNSIIYSDAFIDSVINIISALDAFSSVTYISDHGEDLLDDSRDFTDHGHASPPSKYVAHVPLFFWYSKKFETRFPNKVSFLLQHKDAPASSENILTTLTSMAGIYFPEQDSLKDLSSVYFKNNNQLVLGDNSKIYFFSTLK